MKKIVINISEFELDDNWEPIAVKKFASQALLGTGKDADDILPFVCDNKCNEVKEFFLKERENVPFTKIKKEEILDKQQIRNELIDEIIEGIEAKNINELGVIDRLANLLEKLRNRRENEELKD